MLEPVVSAGNLGCFERVRDTKVLLRLFEAHLPKRFRPREEVAHDVTGDLADLIPEARMRRQAH